MIPTGIRVSTTSPSTKTIQLGSGRKISHIGGTTGAYIDTTHIFYDEEKMTFIELKLKESCFYMDWDEDNKTWKYDVATDSDQLRKKVEYFEERLEDSWKHWITMNMDNIRTKRKPDLPLSK
jgi:hypothetical protein